VNQDFTPEQTVELDKMFELCGIGGLDWVDIPAWIDFTVQVPVAGGGLLPNQKQSAGSAQGADFYLRRIQLINFTDPTNGPQVLVQIKLPTGRFLQSGNSSSSLGIAGSMTPGPLGLVKPEVPCPAGSVFTIDLQNITGTFNPPGSDITVTIVFVGVYRYRLRRAC
jgi:hypothetical protein